MLALIKNRIIAVTIFQHLSQRQKTTICKKRTISILTASNLKNTPFLVALQLTWIANPSSTPELSLSRHLVKVLPFRKALQLVRKTKVFLKSPAHPKTSTQLSSLTHNRGKRVDRMPCLPLHSKHRVTSENGPFSNITSSPTSFRSSISSPLTLQKNRSTPLSSLDPFGACHPSLISATKKLRFSLPLTGRLTTVRRPLAHLLSPWSRNSPPQAPFHSSTLHNVRYANSPSHS